MVQGGSSFFGTRSALGKFPADLRTFCEAQHRWLDAVEGVGRVWLGEDILRSGVVICRGLGARGKPLGGDMEDLGEKA